MPTIALIGPDGAGKTTLARRLENSRIRSFRYLYMGVSVSSSNILLPTTRLVEMLKPRLRREEKKTEGTPEALMEGGAQKEARSGGLEAFWSAARLANRLAEEWFRQCLSWYYQFLGYVVLYDRHFYFDFADETMLGRGRSLDRRLHRWFLEHFYPRPDLVIFLDAPGEVLYARKGELTLEELERRRQMFLRMGRGLPGFVRVDATRPLNEVYREIAAHVECFCRSEGKGGTAAAMDERPEPIGSRDVSGGPEGSDCSEWRGGPEGSDRTGGVSAPEVAG